MSSDYFADLFAGMVCEVPRPPEPLTFAQLNELIERVTPPRRVVLVNADRVETIKAKLAEAAANETDPLVLLALERIEVVGSPYPLHSEAYLMTHPDEYLKSLRRKENL